MDKSNICAYSDNELRRNIRGRKLVIYRVMDEDSERGRGKFGLREVKAGQEEKILRLEWGREYG